LPDATIATKYWAVNKRERESKRIHLFTIQCK